MSEQGQSGGGEKTHEPSPKKLADARKKGDIVKSPDLSASAGYLGLVLAFAIAGPNVIENLGSIITQTLGRADTLSVRILGSGGAVIAGRLMIDSFLAIVPIFAFPVALVLLSIFAQRSVIFVPSKLVPKRNRISPISVAKNKFGLSGLFEFTKSFVKLLVFSAAVAGFMAMNKDLVLGSIYAPAGLVARAMMEHLVNFLWLVFGIALVVSAADYLWQSFDHKRKLMMSRQELVDETKSSEGDPHMKQMRRQRGYDIATQRMMTKVPDADVVIVNPEHYAVALRWDRATGQAPICVAKGVDEIAMRIRTIAAQAGVPVHRDPPTARAIHGLVNLGDEIPPEQYKAVAAAIRYAEKIRKLAIERGK